VSGVGKGEEGWRRRRGMRRMKRINTIKKVRF